MPLVVGFRFLPRSGADFSNLEDVLEVEEEGSWDWGVEVRE